MPQLEVTTCNRPTCGSSKLYRLLFVGGPFDGFETHSDALPERNIALPSGPSHCATKTGDTLIPRLAAYQLSRVEIDLTRSAPVALCRFVYCKTMTGHPVSKRGTIFRWCKRWLKALGRWAEPCLS